MCCQVLTEARPVDQKSTDLYKKTTLDLQNNVNVFSRLIVECKYNIIFASKHAFFNDQKSSYVKKLHSETPPTQCCMIQL